jgi:hypothetical protein
MERKGDKADRLWRALRAAPDGLTYAEMTARARISLSGARANVAGWLRAGFLEKAQQAHQKPATYRVTGTAPTDTPRLSRDGSTRTETPPRQRLWQSMRMLGEFQVSELMLVARSSRSAAYNFIISLQRAGFVRMSRTYGWKSNRQARYRLVRRSGPKAPFVTRCTATGTRRLHDPNTNETFDVTKGREHAR